MLLSATTATPSAILFLLLLLLLVLMITASISTTASPTTARNAASSYFTTAASNSFQVVLCFPKSRNQGNLTEDISGQPVAGGFHSWLKFYLEEVAWPCFVSFSPF